MKDDLGRRLKHDYEDALRLKLPRRTNAIVRIDGRAFHRYTASLERPYCRALADALDAAALHLAREMIGCRVGYGQSDEYSFLLTDFDREDAPLWFDGNLQKIVSVSASVFTGAFNAAFSKLRGQTAGDGYRIATFDARVMVIPRREDVLNYFLWRQLDASVNSLNMLASAHFSHDELAGRTTAEKHEMLHSKQINWAKQPADFKRGRVVRPQPGGGWTVDLEIPIFNREPAYLDALVPA